MPSVLTSLSTLERSARAGFGFFRGTFSVQNPQRAIFEPKCWKIPCFSRNSLTGSPIFEPSIPTSLSTLERSARAGFGMLWGPFSVPDYRRAVFEPKCWKIPCFARNSLTGNHICVPSVPTNLSTLERCARASIRIFQGPFSVPDNRRAVFEPKCCKIPSFACNSLTGNPICVPSVPTSLSTLVRSPRVGFGIFWGPFPIPDPRRAVFEPKCWKIPSFARNSLTGNPICMPSVPTSLSTLK